MAFGVCSVPLPSWRLICPLNYFPLPLRILCFYGFHIAPLWYLSERKRVFLQVLPFPPLLWVYRTGKMYADKQIVLYEYQPSRKADHPREFLKNFSGVCVTDGYQVYHTIEKEREDLKIAGCWAHARRRFDEAVKAQPKEKRKNTLAYMALKQIQAIYREENKLETLSPQERLEHRQLTVKPLVDAYFAWVKQNLMKVPAKSKTANGFTYSLNQEQYLRCFLEDGEVPMDNNAAEQSIRGFCIGKKNWVMIDTVAGAETSAIIYSIAETAKRITLNRITILNIFWQKSRNTWMIIIPDSVKICFRGQISCLRNAGSKLICKPLYKERLLVWMYPLWSVYTWHFRSAFNKPIKKIQPELLGLNFFDRYKLLELLAQTLGSFILLTLDVLHRYCYKLFFSYFFLYFFFFIKKSIN